MENTALLNDLPTHPVWEFSESLYGHDIVKNTCLRLQNHYGFNINIILFACWFSQTGRGRLLDEDFQRIDSHLSQWHHDITSNLRGLRQKFPDIGTPNWSQGLRNKILAEELFAEQVEQLILADSFDMRPIVKRTLLQKATDAVSNIFNYANYMGVKMNQGDSFGVFHILALVFPEITVADLEQISEPLLNN